MWQAIADRETCRRSWSTIEEIERCLLEPPAAEDVGAPPNPALGNGVPGRALFFSYLAAARESSEDADHALEALERSADALVEARTVPSLYLGFCGVGWVLEHLSRQFFEADGDLCAEIDEALREVLSKVSERQPYELIGGLSGIGVYLVERLPNPGAADLLSRVLDLLVETTEESEAGTAWYTPPDWLTDSLRGEMPEGCFNLGVAHGIPGVIGFLAAAEREGFQDRRIRPLAESAIRWMLGQKRASGDESLLPAFVIPGRESVPTRTAWCYGDLGFATVLLSAARSFGRTDWEAEAISLARLAARRPTAAMKAVDVGLCHGTAGIAHLFNRLYQATGDAELKVAALSWFRRTLDMKRPGEGLAGLLSWFSPVPGEGSWRSETGFLVGIAGVGLALLAAVTEVEPAWDRVMLVSIPPRR
ncbi:MAG: lanthionine synthetase C family protein [Acidobacteriota bacterium]